MSIPADYEAAREKFALTRLEFPGAEIELFPVAEIASRQSEFSKHPNWRPHWLAIGIDHSVGDPLFLNVKDAALPVLTWMPEIDPDAWMVAVDPEVFFEALKLAAAADEDPEKVLESIDELNDGAVDLDFWASILDQELPTE